jgi:hypothetical protein
LSATTIGLVVFTGVVMMAAKHLDFTLANIAMIIIVTVLIVLEVKRSKTLKYINPKKKHIFNTYKIFGSKILYIEVAMIIFLALWMWLL